MKADFTTNGKFDVKKIQLFLQYYLVDKSPITLPENIKEILVKIAPYFAILGVIVSLPVILAAVGISLFALPFAAVTHTGFNYFFGILFALVTIVFEIILIPGLFGRTKKAWDIMFYFTVVNVILYLISFNLGGLIIGSLISFYFLFQLRSKYTK